MGSESSGSQKQSSNPGTQSPVTATLQSLFGSPSTTSGGQYQPQGFAGPGALFTPQSFAALPGLLQNIPLNATEQQAIGLQGQGLQNAIGSQNLLQQGAAALPALLETNPTASIAAARRGFSQETLPAILERAPGFSSSDLQRELTRAGTDLETNIAALKEANLGRVGQVVQGLPQFAQAYGSNLLDQAAQTLGFGQIGRDLMRETSPAGDAFRVLAALQSLTGPALSNLQSGGSSQSSKGYLT